MVKYHLKDMRNLIQANTKECLKLVKEKIKYKTNIETKTAKKIFANQKEKLFFFHYNKPKYFKIKYLK